MHQSQKILHKPWFIIQLVYRSQQKRRFFIYSVILRLPVLQSFQSHLRLKAVVQLLLFKQKLIKLEFEFVVFILELLAQQTGHQTSLLSLSGSFQQLTEIQSCRTPLLHLRICQSHQSLHFMLLVQNFRIQSIQLTEPFSAFSYFSLIRCHRKGQLLFEQVLEQIEELVGLQSELALHLQMRQQICRGMDLSIGKMLVKTKCVRAWAALQSLRSRLFWWEITQSLQIHPQRMFKRALQVLQVQRIRILPIHLRPLPARF